MRNAVHSRTQGTLMWNPGRSLRGDSTFTEVEPKLFRKTIIHATFGHLLYNQDGWAAGRGKKERLASRLTDDEFNFNQAMRVLCNCGLAGQAGTGREGVRRPAGRMRDCSWSRTRQQLQAIGMSGWKPPPLLAPSGTLPVHSST